ncbi:conserved hypothetical protein [Clostridium carboxidivorans P7]|uniref:Uncharacterized protein n=1 Tax=Clostridium carboxidivorans P7 TaxID=536227 RepID=C6Q1K2_9CLOT|nr:hypothetical protein [Clostridium carboxidivorans]EET84619.1 conserved hypothetical protein [Clostridium carboxidivorans P7]
MIFNDYDYRDLTTGIKVKFKRKDEKPLSVWEVANFINNFSTYYYKFEIIETIAIALNESIDPRNIFIFSKSFLLNNVYSELDIIDLSNSEIPYILSLGNMISMFPNDKLININFILKAYNEINEILKNAKIYKTVDSSYIIKCFNNIKHLPVGKEIKNLETECNVFISDLEDKNLKEKVKEVFKNIKKEYFEYGQSKIKIKSLFDLNINYKQISFLEDRSMYNLSAQEKNYLILIFISFLKYYHDYLDLLLVYTIKMKML